MIGGSIGEISLQICRNADEISFAPERNPQNAKKNRTDLEQIEELGADGRAKSQRGAFAES